MKLHFDNERKIAYIKLNGTLSSEEILRAFDDAVASDGYRKGMGRLWDFTEADLSGINSASIREMADYSTKFPPPASATSRSPSLPPRLWNTA